MNGFRLLGDLFHVIALICLFKHFYKTRSSKGVSGCSLILFALVYTSRYLDLPQATIFYVFAMKVFYILISYFFIYLSFFHFNDAKEEKHIEFSFYFLLLPCIILAQLFSYENTVIEILWAFSIYLEAVAIIPQMFLIYRRKKAECYIKSYMVFLFLYRGFYILNWIYRYFKEDHFDLISICGGVVDVSIFIFFFVYYSVSVDDKTNLFAANLPEVITNDHFIKDNLEKKAFLSGNQPEIHCISDGKY